jgi:hypothetical protein
MIYLFLTLICGQPHPAIVNTDVIEGWIILNPIIAYPYISHPPIILRGNENLP